jgi:YidC/Oxa1 family membrane protein insertase
MFDFLARALALCYDVWPSFGGAIALFTLAIMLVLTPLSIKSTRSMIKMQRLQPEMKRIQAQFKGDREAQNREMMAFYQANNINPLSSCLPMLLQLPVFFVLYQVVHGLTKTNAAGEFVPKYLDHSSHLFRALEGKSEMLSFGIDLSRSSLKAMNESGFGPAFPYFLMVAIVAGTTWYQQRQIQGRNPNAAANPQQQMIAKIVPFMMIPITISVPAGVVIYFVISNVVRVGQQGLITYLEYRDDPAPVVRPATGDGSAKTLKQPKPPKAGGTDKPVKPATPPKPPKPSGRVTPPRGSAARHQNNRRRKRK